MALAALSFLLQYHVGLDLGDEGFVWYGAVRTAQGEVPLRDFRSYDPGWYYWSAGWFRLLGSDGVVALRLSAAVAQAAGLAAALAMLARTTLGFGALVAAGLLHVVWMFGLGEVLSGTVSLVAMAAASALLERPTWRRHFLAGAFVGLAAFVGRNHGLYCALAFLALLAWIHRRAPGSDRWRCAGAWIAGVVAGYSPMLVMCLATPGFRQAFMDSIAFWLLLGRSNLPRPVPWPWSAGVDSPSASALGVFFVMTPAFLALVVLLIHRRPALRSSPLMAAVAVGSFYVHYTFSRPDVHHLARGAIHPLLFAAMALLATIEGPRRRAASIASLSALAALSVMAAGPRHAVYARLTTPSRFQRITIAGDALWTERADAALIRAARKLKEETRGDLYVAFVVPGLYPVLHQRSPVWDTYPLLPETPARQNEMIEELARGQVNRALICPWEDEPDPGGWGFANTHRRVWTHLRDGWMAVGEVPAYGCRVLSRR